LRPRVAHGLELVQGLDPFAHDLRAQLRAQVDQAPRQLLLARVLVDAFDQRDVELHVRGLEVDDAREVRVAGAEVVDHDLRARALADLVQHAHADVEVLEGGGLRDLDVDAVLVEADGIIGPHQPARGQLLRVHVDEDLHLVEVLEGHLADRPAQAPAGLLRDRVLEQGQGRSELFLVAAHQALDREAGAVAEVDDGLEDHVELITRQVPHAGRVGRGMLGRRHEVRQGPSATFISHRGTILHPATVRARRLASGQSWRP